jgi:hypothetical protein
MLDYKKLDKEFNRVFDSYTRGELLDWVEMDRKRMAELEKKERPRLNGATRSVPIQPRAANGRFVSKKPADDRPVRTITAGTHKKKVAV